MSETLHKQGIIEGMAEKTGLTKGDSEESLNALIEVIEDTLVDEGRVQLVGFGTFEPRYRKARQGRNPQTGEDMMIGASKSAGFKVGTRLKRKMNDED